MVARYTVAAMEGALLLARARRSTEPLRETAELLAGLVEEGQPPAVTR